MQSDDDGISIGFRSDAQFFDYLKSVTERECQATPSHLIRLCLRQRLAMYEAGLRVADEEGMRSVIDFIGVLFSRNWDAVALIQKALDAATDLIGKQKDGPGGKGHK